MENSGMVREAVGAEGRHACSLPLECLRYEFSSLHTTDLQASAEKLFFGWVKAAKAAGNTHYSSHVRCYPSQHKICDALKTNNGV